MRVPLFTSHKTDAPSVSLTMLVASFTVLMLWLLLFVVGVPFVPAFDGGTFAAVFSPIALLYFGNKWRGGAQGNAKPARESEPPEQHEEPEK